MNTHVSIDEYMNTVDEYIYTYPPYPPPNPKWGGEESAVSGS